MSRRFASLALVCGTACNLPRPADVPSTDGGVDAVVVSDASPNMVIGHSVVTHILVDGSAVMTDEDLSGYRVQAYIPNATNVSGYDVVGGTADSNGVVTVNDVPVAMTYALMLTPPQSLDNQLPTPSFYFTDKH